MMRNEQERLEKLATTNPLFGDTKLKLGTFCTNVNGCASFTGIEDSLKLTWENSFRLAELADQMKFQAIVPIGRWGGFGGATDPCGDSFESLTFASAVAARTSYPSVFATVHVPSIHPVMAAKQATTIDHVSHGRFTLNIVSGWNKDEIELFGAAQRPHNERYQVAAEWVSLMKRMWTEEEAVTAEGKYFSLRNAKLRPFPISGYPAIMSAGASPQGIDFAAQHADVAFTAFHARDDHEKLKAHLQSFRNAAKEKYGRHLRVWINAYIVDGESEQDAQRRYDYIVKEKGDREAVTNMFKMMGIGDSKSFTAEQLQSLTNEFIAGWGGYQLKGTKEKIVDEFKSLQNVGVDGILVSWPDAIPGMERFQETIHPLLVQEGLR